MDYYASSKGSGRLADMLREWLVRNDLTVDMVRVRAFDVHTSAFHTLASAGCHGQKQSVIVNLGRTRGNDIGVGVNKGHTCGGASRQRRHNS